MKGKDEGEGELSLDQVQHQVTASRSTYVMRKGVSMVAIIIPGHAVWRPLTRVLS